MEQQAATSEKGGEDWIKICSQVICKANDYWANSKMIQANITKQNRLSTQER